MDDSFLVMIDSKMDLAELEEFLVRAVLGPYRSLHPSDGGHAWVTFKHSHDFDPELSKGEDGWLYYPYRLEVVPRKKELDVAANADLACEVLRFLRGQPNTRAHLCADFEKEVNSLLGDVASHEEEGA